LAIVCKIVRRTLVICRYVNLCLVLSLSSFAARAQTIEESSIKVPVGEAMMDVAVYRPIGRGPFPVVVISHGSPRSPADRAKPIGFSTQARAFARKGFLAVVPTRRGYGATGGAYAEDYGRCSDPDYVQGGLGSAQDITAAAEAAIKLAGADAKRVVLVGVSAGGWGSLAAASKGVAGLIGVVNFAGGRGSRGPNSVCAPDRLVEAAGRFGRSSRVAELWIYTENDMFFGPDLAARMHAAFTEAGGRAQLIQPPAFGDDGHRYFPGGTESWMPLIQPFLRQIGALR
jgi:dienelactone hydrolase